jgi:RNA polymerase sigma-70 factor (ECF subfamily)
MTYENIVEKFSDTVTRICMIKCKNYHNAEDCYQNVMLKLYQNIDTISQLDDESTKKWLIKVALNECTNLYRKLILHRTESLDELIVADGNHFKDRELLNMVLKLPQKYKDVIYLYYYEEYSINEIAEMLGCPQATVKTRLRRGRDRLKVQIETLERLGETI